MIKEIYTIKIGDKRYELPFPIEIEVGEEVFHNNYKQIDSNEKMLADILIQLLEKYNEGDKNGKI